MNHALRKIAEEAIRKLFDTNLDPALWSGVILDAIHQGIRVALEERPNAAQFDTGFAAISKQYADDQLDDAIEKVFEVYRAMTAQKLKEMEGKT